MLPAPRQSPASPDTEPPSRPPGPGRPKDLEKRAAILEAAKRLFTRDGFAGASMDQIATEAGVSKLTVYSHFGDKDTLFVEAVKTHCDQGLPAALFDPAGVDMPLRERLLQVAHAFFAMISAPEAVAGHRMLCTPQIATSPLPQLFWEAGPQRVQGEFAALLSRRMAVGELQIDDIPRAASQFCALLKGEPHARMVLGCCAGGQSMDEAAIQAHLAASVDLFLRTYGRGEHGRPLA